MKRLATSLLLSVWALSGAGIARVAAQESIVRPMPYPFHHLLTIASDVDQQEPWHGAAIFSFINRVVGLPIAGSMWVNAATQPPETSALFAGDQTLNRAPSQVEGLPVYALLLRQWHRGELDHLHAWHADDLYTLRNVMAPPVAVKSATVTLSLELAPPSLRQLRGYTHLRLLFNSPPPPDLTIVAVDEAGRKAVADMVAVNRGAAVQSQRGSETWIEVIFDEKSASRLDGIQIDPGFRLAAVTEVRLVAPSCESGCATAVNRIERDTFSRQTILHQLPWLEAWNIRPNLYTSHGGFSMSQTLWPRGDADLKLDTTAWAGNTTVVSSVRGLLDEPSSFAYSADLLHRIGVDHIWPYSRNQDHDWNTVRPPLHATADHRFYLLSRGRNPDVPTTTFDEFSKSFLAVDPALDLSLLRESYCTNTCWNDQGVLLGVQIAIALDRIKSGHLVDAIYYTHLATGDDDWLRTPRDPLKRPVVEMLRALASYSYDFEGRVPESERVWVPPPSTAARYRVLVEGIQRHIRLSGSDISIDPWMDSVTGRPVPDLSAGTRDLAGLTVYVPDPERATVRVGETQIRSITRNPADATGRGSVTIVDDHLPSTIIGALPLARLGSIVTTGGDFADAPWPTSDGKLGSEFPRFVLRENGEGSFLVRPRNLTLYNTTHLKLLYRHIGAGHGTLFLDLFLEDGSQISISEGSGSEPPREAGSGWWIPAAAGDELVSRTLATHSMLFSKHKDRFSRTSRRPPLPIGRVAAVRIGLLNGGKGEGIELLGFSALRPSGDAVAPDGHVLLAGRVTRSGSPAPGIAVSAADGSGQVMQTVSDADGIYVFPNLRRGQAIYVAAQERPRQRCAPLGSPVVEMEKNEAELDIELTGCPVPPVDLFSGPDLGK